MIRGVLPRMAAKPLLLLLLVSGCAALLCAIPAPLTAQDGQFGGRTAEEWIAQVESEDPDARRQALYALGRIGPSAAPAALDAVTVAVDDIKQEVRWYAVDTLGSFGEAAAPATPTIVAGVRDPANDRFFALAAFRTLGKIGPAAREAKPLLTEAMENSDAAYRAAAAAALWRIEPAERPLEVPQDSLSQREQAEGAVFAAEQLGELGPGRVKAEPLLRGLAHPQADVRRLCARALAEYPAAEVLPILTALLERKAANAEAVLAAARYQFLALELPQGSPPPPSVAPLLAAIVPLFEDPSAEVQLAAADVLAHAGASALGPLLESGSGLQSEGTRTALVEWEFRSGNVSLSDEQLAPLAPRLLAGLAAENAAAQLAAVRLIAALDAAPRISGSEPLLRELLRSSDAAHRRFAAKALRGSTQP